MKEELLKLFQQALDKVNDDIRENYRPATARQERTQTLLNDLISAIEYL